MQQGQRLVGEQQLGNPSTAWRFCWCHIVQFLHSQPHCTRLVSVNGMLSRPLLLWLWLAMLLRSLPVRVVAAGGNSTSRMSVVTKATETTQVGA